MWHISGLPFWRRLYDVFNSALTYLASNVSTIFSFLALLISTFSFSPFLLPLSFSPRLCLLSLLPSLSFSLPSFHHSLPHTLSPFLPFSLSPLSLSLCGAYPVMFVCMLPSFSFPLLICMYILLHFTRVFVRVRERVYLQYQTLLSLKQVKHRVNRTKSSASKQPHPIVSFSITIVSTSITSRNIKT